MSPNSCDSAIEFCDDKIKELLTEQDEIKAKLEHWQHVRLEFKIYRDELERSRPT